jgi:hypothetical protein
MEGAGFAGEGLLQLFKIIRREASLIEDTSRCAEGNVCRVVRDNCDAYTFGGGFHEFHMTIALADFDKARSM